MRRFLTIRSCAGAACLIAALLAGSAGALIGACGPFTDVAADVFCPFVLEIFYLGITTGTTATTYDPTSPVSRLQMAAFLSRTVDRTLQRAGRRAALGQFWTPQNASVLPTTTLPSQPRLLRSDGTDVWVANGDNVSRVRGSDGRLLQTWTGASGAQGVLIAMNHVFATGGVAPGNLYEIDPTLAPGAASTVASNLPNLPFQITFDGARIWTANDATISIVTPGATIPWTVTTVTVGILAPNGILFDGTSIWETEANGQSLQKLDANGAVLVTVTLGGTPQNPVFDGANIWTPVSNSVAVVRATTSALLTTLTGNGLNLPFAAAFDGSRILVTNLGDSSVSLFKAADLTPLGNFPTGDSPLAACSDGAAFWISFAISSRIARF
ncbi:MAG TPA: S-layer homology domain-containing protein [Thermoanaerobaculia bacterium]|nr:S-layer homology domain-containing protein [Thermoanaerobaculia bacterium]